MAILGQITLDELQVLEVDSDPSTSGVSANIGSIALLKDGVSGKQWIKFGAATTNWAIVNRQASGTALPVGSVPFADASGYMISDTNLFWDNTAKSMTVGPAGTALTNNPFSANGTVNNFLQLNAQNTSNGNLASSDLIATADTGTDTTNFVNMGINSSGNTDATFTVAGAADGYLYASDGNLAIGTAASKDLKFFVGGTLAANERLRISATNTAVIVGASAPIDISGVGAYPRFQIVNTSTVQMAAIQYSNDSISPVFNAVKSRGATVGTQVILLADDELGRFQFRGSDGINFQAGASIRALVDGTPGTNSMPGRLIFMTTPTSAITPVERLRISQDGTILATGFLNSIGGFRIANTTDATNGNIRFNGVGVELYRNGWRDLSFPKYNYDDFIFSTLGGTTNQNGFAAVSAAGGTSALQGAATGNNYAGLVQIGTGTTNNATGVSAIDSFNSVGKMLIGGVPLTIEWRVRIPVLSTGTVTFTARVGLQDSTATGDPTNGVYFAYTNGVNTGQWQGITRSASTSTTVNSTVAIVANTWYRLRAEINAAGTNCDFYIDSGSGYVLIGSSVTNIPTIALRPISKINKSNTSTTSSGLDMDWCWWVMER